MLQLVKCLPPWYRLSRAATESKVDLGISVGMLAGVQPATTWLALDRTLHVMPNFYITQNYYFSKYLIGNVFIE